MDRQRSPCTTAKGLTVFTQALAIQILAQTNISLKTFLIPFHFVIFFIVFGSLGFFCDYFYYAVTILFFFAFVFPFIPFFSISIKCVPFARFNIQHCIAFLKAKVLRLFFINAAVCYWLLACC